MFIVYLGLTGLILWYAIGNYFFKKTTYYKITKNGFASTIFNLGRNGEYLTYKRLRNYEKKGAKFLFNVYLPREKDETTEIDVLMIASTGIYVFESKNYSGWIFGDEKSKTWTQTLPQGKKSHKEHFLNPIMQNKLHIKWLKNFLKNEDILVHSIIVFSERCELKKVIVTSNDIKVIKRAGIAWTVNKIDKNSPNVLSQKQINEIYEALYPCSQISEEDKEKHIQQIRKNLENKDEQLNEEVNTDKKICPRCGNLMILRTANKGENKGKQFYGCTAFPKCRFIEKC